MRGCGEGGIGYSTACTPFFKCIFNASVRTPYIQPGLLVVSIEFSSICVVLYDNASGERLVCVKDLEEKKFECFFPHFVNPIFRLFTVCRELVEDVSVNGLVYYCPRKPLVLFSLLCASYEVHPFFSIVWVTLFAQTRSKLSLNSFQLVLVSQVNWSFVACRIFSFTWRA